METKANHVLVGLFSIIVTLAVFVFVYWLARLDEATNRQPIYVVFEGAVTGLNTGSSVLFNGIKVGEVIKLDIDPTQPTRVRALLDVDRRTPLKADTVARLEYQGLTGVGAVQLLGGSAVAAPLSAPEGQVPVIYAEKSEFQDLMDAGRVIVSRMTTVLDKVDNILGNNEESINRTIRNVETFTDSLAGNADRIDKLFADASALAERLNNMSSGVDELIKGINALVGEGGGDLMKNVGSAFKRIDTFLADNGPALNQTVSNVEQFTTTLNNNRDQIDVLMKDASQLATRLNTVSQKLETVVDRANTMLDGDAQNVVKDAAGVFNKLDTFLATNGESLDRTVANVEKFTGALSDNSAEVGSLIADASKLAAKMNKVSDDLDALVLRVSQIVDEDGADFVKEARIAAQNFRKLSSDLDQRIGTATDGIARATGRGFKEFEAFVIEGRSTLRNMQRVIERLERNPQRFFFGRSQVPEYNPN